MGFVHKTWFCPVSVTVPWEQPSKSKCTYEPGGVFHSVKRVASGFSKYGAMFGLGVNLTGKDSSTSREKPQFFNVL